MKCSHGRCKKKAEFCLEWNERIGFCENHAIEYLKQSNESFLPRIKEKKNVISF